MKTPKVFKCEECEARNAYVLDEKTHAEWAETEKDYIIIKLACSECQHINDTILLSELGEEKKSSGILKL